MPKPAVFWDRDGTLIEDPGYLNNPDQVKVLPGAANALRRLASAGYENIITTNQSGVARGMMDETTVAEIHLRLREMLAREGAALDAIYYCPYLDGPDAVVEKYRQDSDLRKPKPGMLVKASLERNIDLPASWSIGDSLRDAEAGRSAGCRTILISSNGQAETNTARRSIVDFVAQTPEEAAEIVLRYTPGALAPSQLTGIAQPPDAASSQARSIAPAGVPAAPVDSAPSEKLLHDIFTILHRMDRRSREETFSLPRLGGAIMQMAAIGAIVWAVFALGEAFSTQLIRLGYAIVFQLIALTLFSLDRKT